jgi:hypothetical protein
VFSVVDGVLLKPLPYPESDRLIDVLHDAPGAPGLTAVAGGLQLSPSMLVTFQDRADRERDGTGRARAGGGRGRDEPSP